MIDFVREVLEDRIYADYKKSIKLIGKKTSFGLYFGKEDSTK
jgi:hypothetical protein